MLFFDVFAFLSVFTDFSVLGNFCLLQEQKNLLLYFLLEAE